MTFNIIVLRATDKCLSFFKILKKAFEWTGECQKAFKELKACLASIPLLSPSKPNKDLSLYLAISSITVSPTLIREKGHV